MTTRRVLGVATAVGLTAGTVRKWRAWRRRQLALVPIGITAGAGMTLRESRRLADLRELAKLTPLHVDKVQSGSPTYKTCSVDDTDGGES